MKLILASGSPRRRELLAEAGVEFEVILSPAEEIHDAAIPLAELCERNAELKALAVADSHPQATVIGADTLVWIDGEPLGKPKDMADARAMLRKLSGRSHTVCTGVCVVVPDEGAKCFHELTEVRFRLLDEALIDAYFQAADPLDKAGAYGIQESGEMIVEGIVGSFDNVMGLPVAKVLAALSSK
ncbi:nucleoside triphosphate pyrophosphatase [Luteolibacter sp. Populi]|uniref:Maf family protein n=1 Tax=Luteolibacter sp. Populi TaxID=3230487 RepID=UPI0034664EF6